MNQNTNQNDPHKIVLPVFDPSIFTTSKKVGSNPKDILLEVGMKEGEVVADFGCGVGFFVTEASQIVGSSGKVYAVDIDQKLLDSLKVKSIEGGMRNVYGILADLEQPKSTKLPDGSCDIVLIINLLYLIKNKKAVLSEAHRILKNGGQMVVMDWSSKSNNSLLEKDEHVSSKEVKDLARTIGLRFVKKFEAGIAHEVQAYLKG